MIRKRKQKKRSSLLNVKSRCYKAKFTSKNVYRKSINKNKEKTIFHTQINLTPGKCIIHSLPQLSTLNTCWLLHNALFYTVETEEKMWTLANIKTQFMRQEPSNPDQQNYIGNKYKKKIKN